jgi:hypothetical protein
MMSDTEVRGCLTPCGRAATNLTNTSTLALYSERGMSGAAGVWYRGRNGGVWYRSVPVRKVSDTVGVDTVGVGWRRGVWRRDGWWYEERVSDTESGNRLSSKSGD